MRIVDTHAHVSTNWFEPLETLGYHMHAAGVARAILTQVLGQTDNAYVQRCRREDPQRFGTIVVVDADQPDVGERLRQLVGDGAAGVRLRPRFRSPFGDGLAVWRAAAELGITVSAPGASEDFLSDEFAAVLTAFPDLPVVIEHLGGRNAPDATDALRAQRHAVFGLARFPNAYLKIHGLGEFATRTPDRTAPEQFERPIPTYLGEALSAFGPQRLLWGSDFPLVCAREGYANALQLCWSEFNACSETERAAIFGGVADRLFPPSR